MIKFKVTVQIIKDDKVTHSEYREVTPSMDYSLPKADLEALANLTDRDIQKHMFGPTLQKVAEEAQDAALDVVMYVMADVRDTVKITFSDSEK